MVEFYITGKEEAVCPKHVATLNLGRVELKNRATSEGDKIPPSDIPERIGLL